MRNIAEISKDLSAKVAATKAMDRKADEAAFRAAMDEVNALTQELNDARSIEAAEQAAAARQLQDLEKKENRRFSITKFLREAAEGKLSGLEAEVAEMGAKEYERMGLSRKGFVVPMAALRSSAGQNYTTDADGGYAKETAAPTYLEGLKDRLVVNKLGAHVLGDLVGTVPFVSAGAISAAWLAEGAEASVSKSTFAKVSLTPHRNVMLCSAKLSRNGVYPAIPLGASANSALYSLDIPSRIMSTTFSVSGGVKYWFSNVVRLTVKYCPYSLSVK